jgi:murein DD-endopeptidase MepM/ murein hydrolase activator NlpD
MVTVILDSDGFDDLLERVDYLDRIRTQDERIVGRVRDLRNEMALTVERVRGERDKLAKARAGLEAKESALSSARAGKQQALAGVNSNIKQLEGDLSDLSAQIQEQLAGYGGSLPAGPIRGGAGGFIWPVNGPVVSPFGMRWGRLHAGIDIAVPSGTPIRASKSGTIVLASYYGGYGNYTCINHGGGISTCYAHQSSYARTSGSVGQGQVIGYVGCTGHCYGPHLHFEVRVNGVPQNPLNYL